MSRRGCTTRIYVGNLPDDIREKEIEDIFYKFGRIRDIDIKCGRNSNGKAYAFVEFEDSRGAEDAVYSRDGCKFAGSRLRVEFTGERRPRRIAGKTSGPPKRTEYRVIVTGLPQSASWQDLKDHMRQVGSVGYANIEHGTGIVEYESYNDMERAIRKLDQSEFKNIFHSCCIRVRRDDALSSRRRRRSHSRGRSSRSISYSGRRSRRRRSGRRYSRSSSFSRSGRSSDREVDGSVRSLDRSSSRSRRRGNSGSRIDRSYSSNRSGCRRRDERGRSGYSIKESRSRSSCSSSTQSKRDRSDNSNRNRTSNFRSPASTSVHSNKSSISDSNRNSDRTSSLDREESNSRERAYEEGNSQNVNKKNHVDSDVKKIVADPVDVVNSECS